MATLGGNVDLRAQVRDTTGVTFSWNTSAHLNAYTITIERDSQLRPDVHLERRQFRRRGEFRSTLTVTNWPAASRRARPTTSSSPTGTS